MEDCASLQFLYKERDTCIATLDERVALSKLRQSERTMKQEEFLRETYYAQERLYFITKLIDKIEALFAQEATKADLLKAAYQVANDMNKCCSEILEDLKLQNDKLRVTVDMLPPPPPPPQQPRRAGDEAGGSGGYLSRVASFFIKDSGSNQERAGDEAESSRGYLSRAASFIIKDSGSNQE